MASNTFILRAASTPAPAFKHSKNCRILSLDHYGDKEENESQYLDLQNGLKVLGVKPSELSSRQVYGYDADSEFSKFKQLSKRLGVTTNPEWPTATDLTKAGFKITKRGKPGETSTVYSKDNAVCLADEDVDEAPPMYLVLAQE